MTTTAEFKQWITHVQSPRVERLLKQAAETEVISFAGGLPAEEMFPTAEFQEAFERVTTDKSAEALQYSWTEGYEPLRQQILEYLHKRGIEARPNELLLVSGAQQALSLIAKLLVRPTQTIALETPTYVAAIQAFELQEPRFCGVGRSQGELLLDNFKYLLKRQAPKFFYVVPTGHNPTGYSLSEQQRLEIIELATEHETYIVSDEVYCEIEFSDTHRPLKSYDDVEDLIISVGSFSKLLSPGLRVGWIVAKEEIIQNLIQIKQAMDLQASSLTQVVLSLYLKEHSLDNHIAKCRDFYRGRRDAALEALERYLPSEVSWTKPDAGFSLWLELPESISGDDLLKDAVSAGVAIEPGEPFFPTEKHQNFIRLSYSNLEADQIDEGVRRLSTIIKDHISKTS